MIENNNNRQQNRTSRSWSGGNNVGVSPTGSTFVRGERRPAVGQHSSPRPISSTHVNRPAGSTHVNHTGPSHSAPRSASHGAPHGASRGGRSGGGKLSRHAPSLRTTLRQQRSNKNLERQKPQIPVPPVGENIRIITISGVEEIGKNMLAIEIGNDIMIVDAGFQFKDASTPGIDYILPNTTYLEERKDKIRGIFITHGHLDHIGAIPYVLEKLGNPPIYSRKFGAIMIQKKMEDFPHLPKADIRIIDGDEIIRAGAIKVETFLISHTIPDAMGLIIETKLGDIVVIEDVRVDNISGVPTEEEVNHYKRFAGRNVLLLTLDSTSIEKPGFSISENVVVKNIETIIKNTSSRLIIGTFASQVERILAIIEAAEKYGKKIVVEGRSMKSNLDIVKYLGLIKTNNIIPVTEMDQYPPDRIVMLVTGSQGEEFAALMRMANKSHKYITLRKSDTILLSSSIIPTNHSAVVKLKDSLYRSEAKVITYLDSDVHASGHGNRDELKWIHQQIKYKYFIPLHGHHYMLRQHAEMVESLGVKEENIIVPDNGTIIDIQVEDQKMVRLPMRAPHDPVTVDGLAIGTIQDVVLEDRQLLAEAGIFVVVASINVRTGKLKKSPDIISRGFVYLRESQELLRKARFITQKTVENHLARNKGPVDFDRLKKILSEELSKFLFQETAKQPLVIPVLIGV
jgi:ribonuclease J